MSKKQLHIKQGYTSFLDKDNKSSTGLNLQKWLRKTLKSFGVALVDPCCDADTTTLPTRYNQDVGVEQFYNPVTETWNTIPGGAGGGGGPYTVTNDLPASGFTTVTDTASGFSFVLDMAGALANIPLLTVESGTTGVVGDTANGLEVLNIGDTVHFWSSDASVGVNVTAGSAIVDLTVDTSIPASAVAPAVGVAGDVYYNTTDDILYVSDGAVWNVVGGSTSSIVTSASNPVGATVGDIYYNTTDNNLYTYDGATWNVIGGSTTTADSVVTSATEPVGAVEGDVYYNTVDNLLYAHDGTDWVAVDQFGIPSVAAVAGTDFFGNAYAIGDDIITFPAGVVSIESAVGGISADAGQVLTLGTDTLPLLVKDCGTDGVDAVLGFIDITADNVDTEIPDMTTAAPQVVLQSGATSVNVGTIGGKTMYDISDTNGSGTSQFTYTANLGEWGSASPGDVVTTTFTILRDATATSYVEIRSLPYSNFLDYQVHINPVDGSVLDVGGNTTSITSIDIGSGLQEICLEYIATGGALFVGIYPTFGPLPLGSAPSAAPTGTITIGDFYVAQRVTAIGTGTASPAIPPTPSLLGMVGADATTDGECGFVPAPKAGEEGFFLQGDGTWVAPTATAGGILEVTSGGAVIRYSDDSGTAPTFTSAAGTATLVPNGNKVLSVDFTELSDGSGSFLLTHNNGVNPDVRQWLTATGTTSFFNTALTSDKVSMTVNGLNSNQSQVFAFKF